MLRWTGGSRAVAANKQHYDAGNGGGGGGAPPRAVVAPPAAAPTRRTKRDRESADVRRLRPPADPIAGAGVPPMGRITILHHGGVERGTSRRSAFGGPATQGLPNPRPVTASFQGGEASITSGGGFHTTAPSDAEREDFLGFLLESPEGMAGAGGPLKAPSEFPPLPDDVLVPDVWNGMLAPF